MSDANERRRSCSICNAFGTVYVGDEERTCPDCDGSGWVDDDSTDPTNDAPQYEVVYGEFHAYETKPDADGQWVTTEVTPWCPTCGLSASVWPGCADTWHDDLPDPFHLPDTEETK